MSPQDPALNRRPDAGPDGLERARQELQRAFGHAEFRPGQDEAVRRVLSGEDLTIVMPTGAGKSACYQVPALVRSGLTLVISPLIALMKDQVEGLVRRGIAAELVNSSVPAQEQWRRLDLAAAGKLRLLYVAPERLGAPSFERAMATAPLDMVAIDEAHCISQWGHDFRPAYLSIHAFLQRLATARGGQRPQVIALTATATPRVRTDIATTLGMDPDNLLLTGFKRPNLRLLARRCDRKGDRSAHVARIIKGVGGAAIVYCGTRKDVEEVATDLQGAGLEAAAYHAGLDDSERNRVQEDFLTGRVPIIVATNAFGMGIDKPDIRTVVHHSLPGSIEAYYQEAGRAGRDGETAYCVLLHGSADRHLHSFFLDGSCPPESSILSIHDALKGLPDGVVEMTQEDLANRAGVPSIQCGGALRVLEDAELIERLDDRDNPAQVRFTSDPRELAVTLPAATQRRAFVEWLIERFSPRVGQVLAVKPSLVLSDLDLPRESLLRVLREMAEAGNAEVRAPFRGRGLVLREPRPPTSEARKRLKPQFAALAARRQRAEERLDRIQHYGYTHGCRHAFLLDYFGDAPEPRCTACDNCCGWHDKTEAEPLRAGAKRPASARTARRERRREADMPDEGITTPLALQAVSDLGRRFGIGVAKLVLKGSRSKKVLAAGLESSSAYGGLSRLATAELDTLLDGLQSEGLIQTTQGPYPVAFLSEDGRIRLEHGG